MKHFKLRKDLCVNHSGRTLYRIECIRDLKIKDVKVGALGGFVEKEENLSGNAEVCDDAEVCGDAQVCDNAQVCGDARVCDNAQVCGDVVATPYDVYNITSNSQYNVTITPNFIKIGCEYHTKNEWWAFNDKEIIKMDGQRALIWWKKWKPILQAICEVQNETN